MPQLSGQDQSEKRTTTKARRGTLKAKRYTAPPMAQVPAGQSVIRQKNRERYENGSRGDALARQLRKH